MGCSVSDAKVSEPDRTEGSLRDPFGFLSESSDGTLVRHIGPRLAGASRRFLESDFYASLVESGRLVEHEEVGPESSGADSGLVLEPRRIPVVSYPYEWPFSLLKKAALLTLDIQIEAIDAGFTLRDGTAFNVLFEGVRPVFIDFGSFDVRVEGQPWVGYKQFCEHFLAPLAMASRFRRPPHQFNSASVEGYPLDAASSVMPVRSWLNWGLLWHLHLHGRSIRKRSGGRGANTGMRAVSTRALKGLLTSLRGTVNSLRYPIEKSDWAAYYSDNSYSDRAMLHKEELVEEWLAAGGMGELVLDLGGNAGRFSAIASKYARNVVLVDSDHDSVELAAREFDRRGVGNIHPAVLDLTDPSTGRGWAGRERPGFHKRVRPDRALALALIHHLVIGAGIPMERVAAHFGEITPSVIIEFVPPGDPMVDLLSANKSGQHHEYTRAGFEQAFSAHFSLEGRQELADSGRVLYEFVARS